MFGPLSLWWFAREARTDQDMSSLSSVLGDVKEARKGGKRNSLRSLGSAVALPQGALGVLTTRGTVKLQR